MSNNLSLMSTYSYLPVNLIKGNGCMLYDDNDNEYIDFASGIGVNSLGYCNSEWTKAISNAACNLQHISNIFLNESTLKLADKITNLSEMSKVFFCNSGAEANEGAIKLARKYSFDKYGANRNKILTLRQSFHGRTLATLTATGQDKFHNYFFPFPNGFDYFKANDIDHFIDKLSNDVCAVMMEAIQGEGGVYPLDHEFVKEVYKICKERDILLIFDEVQCGIGRTGKLFGYQHFDINPDIVTIAKGLGAGLPIGGFLCNEKLSNVFKPGDHGTTFGGNPVACSGALVVLNIICTDSKLKEIAENGEYLIYLLKNINSNLIKEVRGKGLMVGLELKIPSSEIQQKALEKGLLVLTAGPNVVRLLPPLIISKEEIKKGIDIINEIISNA
ncbi:MAG: aspartate aminotransferase family protein [Clostridium sp.]|uniref:aspartate aminotransferase family protein n=1 Tax=Clostridium TaxID=1485 RepID=UPI000BE298A1|nr:MULTISPECIES: aspartate aminotransferase family protein [Clostridium]MBS5884220.1 aspartate aminotransferase family protein [Clostridium sp.]MDB1941061.1 aspartate aminotransferase family protein [Clostridium tertium]MDU7147890.1 aspartate aminotransferase family protein [Clostridium sp.]